MQRMLVILVLLLTVVFAVMGVVTFNLYEEVKARPASRTVVQTPRRATRETSDPSRITTLEQRLASLLDEIERLRKEQDKNRRALVAAARAGGEPSGATDLPVAPANGGYASRTDRSGSEFVITDEDLAFFRAVQKRVQTEQRIDSIVKNAFRRIDRLVRNAEIAELSGDSRARVEDVLRRYAVSQDSLVTRYYRDPDRMVTALGPEEKREAVNADREQLAAVAQQELAAIVGDADAAVLAERTLSGGAGSSFRRLQGRDRSGRRNR